MTVTPRRATAGMFVQAQRDADDSQIDDVLREMRRQAHDPADLNRRFEQLCQGVLGALNHGGGRRVFDRVDRWDDWAGRDGSSDEIDLVAHRNSDRDDDAVAIQCHCYSERRLVSKGDVNPFLAKSGSARFRARMLIHTAEGLSPGLQQQIDDQRTPCHVVDLAEMRRWKLDWWAAAEAVGAVTPQHRSRSRATGTEQPGDTESRGPAGWLPGKAGRWLMSGGVGVAAIAAGTLMVFSGADIGALLVLGGILVLARRRGTHRQATPRPADRPPGGRRDRATSQHRPDSEVWGDDDLDWDDGGDHHHAWDLADQWERVERREDEWEREDREFWTRGERDSAERCWWGRLSDEDSDDTGWNEADDEWDRHDAWDDEEPPRRSASRRRSRPSWDTDDDYI